MEEQTLLQGIVKRTCLCACCERRFERFMGRFDQLDSSLSAILGKRNFLDGERLLDNHDLCEMLHVSKRTLQRYRSSGELPFQTIYHKTYYKESDVEEFIKRHFEKGKDED